MHDTDYMRATIVLVRSGQWEYTETIHLYDCKTVILRISSCTVWLEGQHINELPM